MRKMQLLLVVLIAMMSSVTSFAAGAADGLEGGGIDDKDYATFSYDRDTRP